LVGVPDTVKRVSESGSKDDGPWVEETLDRERLRLAQTPQGGRVDWLIDALDRAKAEGCHVTDEASALEHAGRRVAGVEGEPGNRKITSREDLDQARRALRAGPALRVGFGFDVHRFADGRKLVLGGVAFPGETGLDGHSDADVVLHAAMDAVLGPTGLGDIGCLFPPEDPQFSGADSRRLAREVSGRIAERGFELVNLDLMLLAERPKIRPRMEEMRRSIADVFGVASDRVGLKATTMERLGALGRGEGIACQAVALLAVAETS
jgi:2-C-methyl-D-erythritol 2,4-cyclodiphosphate synthase